MYIYDKIDPEITYILTVTVKAGMTTIVVLNPITNDVLGECELQTANTYDRTFDILCELSESYITNVVIVIVRNKFGISIVDMFD